MFLDRDGVLIHDVDLLTAPDQVRVYEGAPLALRRLQEAGYALVVVTNQPVVARGVMPEAEVERTHHRLQALLREASGPELDGFYFCPHHPSADMESYRVACQCRKPRPGMLLQAATDLDLEVGESYMVGDRLSDVAAGRSAGCQTILVRTGKHEAPAIESPDGLPEGLEPDYACADLLEAADVILSMTP